MIGSLSGYTIEYKKAIFYTDEIKDIIFLYIGNEVQFQRNNNNYNVFETLLCKNVIETRDDNGFFIEFIVLL